MDYQDKIAQYKRSIIDQQYLSDLEYDNMRDPYAGGYWREINKEQEERSRKEHYYKSMGGGGVED